MKYVCTLCYLCKIRVKFKNCCGKAINERMKNAKISALQVILYNRISFIHQSKKYINFC